MTISPCLAWNAFSSASERVISVGGMNCAKSSTNNFSGASRTAARIVDDQGLAGDPLEQIGGGDVADVERRVLPHQHDIDVAAEVERERLAGGEMIAGDRAAPSPARATARTRPSS